MPQTHKLAGAMADYWSNFAKHGNPNGQGLPHWPTYNKAHTTLVLDTPIEVRPGIRTRKLRALEQAANRRTAVPQRIK